MRRWPASRSRGDRAQPTFGTTDFAQLPQKARDYLEFLSDQTGVEIAMVSTGPERHHTIWLKEL